MTFRFLKLVLNCRQSVEVVDLSARVSFFHGQISAGKSSIVRLIDYCLGGDLERTLALTQELVSASLFCHIGGYEVILNRESTGSRQVQVTWRREGAEPAMVLAPLQASQDRGPIWEDGIYTLSDLIFFLLGIKPIKVRRSKREPDSPLVRLSFRDLMFYCYLEQEHIDSSFFNMEDPFKRLKSRDVMRFVVGYYTERLNDLDVEIEEKQEDRNAKLQAAQQLSTSLRELGYGTSLDIQADIVRLNSELQSAREEEREIRAGLVKDEHLVDELRVKLRALSFELDSEEQTRDDQRQKIEELERLKAELVSARFKLGRIQAASVVLERAEFQNCPLCGAPVSEMPTRGTDECTLCGTAIAHRDHILASKAEEMQRDLDSRIEDVEASLKRHRQASKRQGDTVDQIRQIKSALDRQLNSETQQYDSNFLARSRDVERKIATIEERILGLERARRLPDMVRSLEAEADRLQGEIHLRRREMEEERSRITKATTYVEQIEREFLAGLILAGVPGVSATDVVKLDTKSWVPYILPNGDEALRWSFDGAGSGGKKTLLKVCYALALHKVAEQNELPLPPFLIIDTPMKNIGEEVNQDIFSSFYTYLYALASDALKKTQFVIVDKEFYPTEIEGLAVVDRFMTPDDESNPPLITYYRGP
jgi:uncharacterized Zn finger protein (UPF0148 family)